MKLLTIYQKSFSVPEHMDTNLCAKPMDSCLHCSNVTMERKLFVVMLFYHWYRQSANHTIRRSKYKTICWDVHIFRLFQKSKSFYTIFSRQDCKHFIFVLACGVFFISSSGSYYKVETKTRLLRNIKLDLLQYAFNTPLTLFLLILQLGHLSPDSIDYHTSTHVLQDTK